MPVFAMKAVPGRMPQLAAATGSSESPRPSASARLIRTLAFCGLAVLGGCSVTAALETEPGVDISSIAPGATREHVEAIVGKPVKEWTALSGVHYCVYRYYGGKQPSHINASGRALLDIATLGILELVYLADAETGKRDREEGKIFPLMAVSYDSQNIVIGAFPEFTQFTVLPPDGRAPAHETPTPSPAVR
jgi:hypothetical protein